MKKYKNVISFRYLFVFIFTAALLVYILIRAYSLSFTHDESLSFMIINGDVSWEKTANNHLLNTKLMSFSSFLWGDSELSLRLPNVLSFILFAIGSFAIFRQSKNIYLIFLGACLIFLNPYLIEFFSLARGYGLSLAFMIMSIFFLIRYKNDQITPSIFLNNFIFSILFGSLAIYSNLTMINFFISLIIIFIIKYWLIIKKYTTQSYFNLKFFSVLLMSFIFLLLAIKRLLLLKKNDELYFGSSDFNKGLDSLINSSIYIDGASYWTSFYIKIIIAVLLITGVLFVILKKKFIGILSTLIILIVFILLGLFMENLIFGAKYPTERTALFYIPIVVIFIYQLFFEIIKHYELKKTYYIPIIACLVIPMLANFIVGVNFTNTKTWRRDTHTKDVMRIIRDSTQNINYKASISNYWYFQPSINYYTTTLKLNLLLADRSGVNLKSNFIYRHNDNTVLVDYNTISSYKDIKAELLIKK